MQADGRRNNIKEVADVMEHSLIRMLHASLSSFVEREAVAIADTGIDSFHPFFDHRAKSRRSFLFDEELRSLVLDTCHGDTAWQQNGRKPMLSKEVVCTSNTTCYGDFIDYKRGHGTGIAGIIGASVRSFF